MIRHRIAGSVAVLAAGLAVAWGWAQSPLGVRSGEAAGVGDSAFASLQARGEEAMGVNQFTSTHVFDALPDGGRIELQRDVDDSAGVEVIRRHLSHVAEAFASGDFSTPASVHLSEVPGAEGMTAHKGAIEYRYADLPRGGEVRLITEDPDALRAIHDFMAFQREEHRAGGTHPATAHHDRAHASRTKHPEREHGPIGHGPRNHGPHPMVPHTGTVHGRGSGHGKGGQAP